MSLHVGVEVDRAVLRPHIPDDVADGWLDGSREPRDALVRPFLGPDYLHPSYNHEQSPAYFGLIATGENWETGVDEYVFGTIDRYLLPILAELETSDGLARWAPGPHRRNVTTQHLMRTSVSLLAVIGRFDLVESALDEYKAKPLLPRNETPERFERFVEWLRMVPQDTWEELRR